MIRKQKNTYLMSYIYPDACSSLTLNPALTRTSAEIFSNFKFCRVSSQTIPKEEDEGEGEGSGEGEEVSGDRGDKEERLLSSDRVQPAFNSSEILKPARINVEAFTPKDFSLEASFKSKSVNMSSWLVSGEVTSGDEDEEEDEGGDREIRVNPGHSITLLKSAADSDLNT